MFYIMHTPYLKSYKQPARYDHEPKFSSVLPVLGALLQSGASLFKSDGADMFVTSRSIRHWSTSISCRSRCLSDSIVGTNVLTQRLLSGNLQKLR